MEYPALLQPTTTEALSLPSARSVLVPKATPQFTPWTGAPPADTYGGKPILDSDGRAAFAELVILDAFRADGWDGVWIDTYRNRFRRSYWDAAPPQPLPDAPGELLRRIVAARGGVRRGTWDVCCWRGSDVLFAEAKRARQDAIRPDQISWLDAALGIGLPVDAFLVVEWRVGTPFRAPSIHA